MYLADNDADTTVHATHELLAWLILAFRPIDAGDAAQLLSLDLAAALQRAGARPVPLEPLPQAQREPAALAKALASEHVRLFVNHPTGRQAHLEALSYSIAEGPAAQAAFHEELAAALARLDLRIVAQAGRPADHLTVLLELLYLDAQGAAALPTHPVTRRFLAGWLPTMLQRLAALEPPPFYRNAARVLEALLLGLPQSTGRARKADSAVPERQSMADSASDRSTVGFPQAAALTHGWVLDSVNDGVLVIDHQRRILYANAAMASYFGVDPATLVGKSCVEVVGFSHCGHCPHAEVIEHRGAYTGHNIQGCGNVGPDSRFCVSASPMRDADGDVIGVVEIYRDMRALGAYIEDIEEKNAQLEHERKRLDDILTDSSDGYFTATLDRRILRTDQKLLELLGRPVEQVVGRSCSEVFGSDKCATDCPITWAAANGKSVIDCREMVRAADGLMPIDKSVFLHTEPDGSTTHVIGVIRNASEIVALRRSMRRARQYKKLISATRRMEEVFELINTFAPTDAPVLILGESGTGKELVAEALQENSPRRNKPFLKINCSALAESLLESELFGHVRGAFTGADRDKRGKFEVAHGGTLFLDEVGDMSPALQTKILRVLEAQEFEPVGSTQTIRVNVRIIAATNRDLRALMREGRFREDLYYRLNAIQIRLPSLGERIEDVPLLVNRFLAELDAAHGRGVQRISARALAFLQRYPWPGNIRELRNAVEFAYVCAKGDRIERQDLPEHIRSFGDKDAVLLGAEDDAGSLQALREAMRRYRGNRRRVAQSLGISRTTLWRRLKLLQDEPASGTSH